uniref:Uncharacterized protein n=1 Tax=Trichuris muris TaxID=70415 RepID=A0A5S6QXD1_TRIMR
MVQPDLNFDRYFSDLNKLRNLLASRGVEGVDVATLSSSYDKWKRLKVSEEKLRVACERLPEGASTGETLEQSHGKLKQVRGQLKEFDVLVKTVQQLPNDLDAATPVGDRKRLLRFIGGKNELLCDHGELLSQKGWLVVKGEPYQSFLVGRSCDLLSRLEQYVLGIFARSGFSLISPPHLVRAAVVRTGAAFSDSHLSLQTSSCDGTDDRNLCLVGHSVFPYLGLFTRRSLSERMHPPVKLVSTGNTYSSDLQDSSFDVDLFSVHQSRALTAFVILDCAKSLLATTACLLDLIEKILVDLHIQANMWQVPSKNLATAESARIDVSVRSHKAVEQCLATVSNFGDYLSRKLRMMCRPDTYMQCLYMEINLHRLLAAVIEHWWSLKNCDELPSVLGQFN